MDRELWVEEYGKGKDLVKENDRLKDSNKSGDDEVETEGRKGSARDDGQGSR